MTRGNALNDKFREVIRIRLADIDPILSPAVAVGPVSVESARFAGHKFKLFCVCPQATAARVDHFYYAQALHNILFLCP